MKKHPFLAQYSRYCQAKQRRKHRKKCYNHLQNTDNYIFHKAIFLFIHFPIFSFTISHSPFAFRHYPISIFIHTTSDTKFRKQSSIVT